MINVIDIFPWSDNFNTGLAEVDQQHRKLAELLNRIASQVASGANVQVLGEIFDELADYAIYHFECEEAIWHTYFASDPTALGHAETHTSFAQEVSRLKMALSDTTSFQVAEDALAFLARWLASHILETDRYMAFVVHAMQEGMSLDEAKVDAREKMAGTTRVLIDIILSIYSTLSSNTLHLMRELNERRLSEGKLQKSERSLNEAQRIAKIGNWELDIPSNKLTWSDEVFRIFEIDKSRFEATYETFLSTIHPEERDAINDAYTRSLEDRTPYDITHRLVMPDGRIKYVHERCETFYNSEGKPIRSIGTVQDITERKQAEEKLELASLVYQNSSEAILVTDENNNIVATNQAFTKLTGFDEQEVLGKSPRILSSGRHGNEFYRAMWASLNNTGRWQGELWNRRKNGETYPEWLTIDTIYKEDGSLHRRVALFQDISEKKKAEEELLSHANYDQLTLLPNRRLFNDRLEQEIRKSHRDKCRTALLFIDLDHFKDVNDTLGHDIGDKLLIEAAGRIKSCVRDYDTVARLGGDEFTVILSKLEDTSDVARIAQSIIDNLSQPFHLASSESFISASIGIAICPDDGTKTGDLIKYADQALYVAKDEGRSRFSFFTKAMQEASNARIQLGVDLRHAIYKGQLEVYYQPIVELATGHTHKAEALLRWKHPVHGFVSPVDFIPVAEDTGSILDIGDWVFLQAANQVKNLMNNGLDIQISINKSPVQFYSGDQGHNHWIEKLNELGLPGSTIAVEITEGLLINNNPDINDKLLTLRDAGIQVSIDDFGTGYSSLSYIKKFDIDYLKIDQSFTQNLSPEGDEFAICEAIVMMAHKLGIKVIAEGVETKQQCDLLKQIGCDYGQGYLFSRPVSAPDFEKWLLVNRS